MCSEDVFASGLVEELDDWENICQKAYTLDKADLLDSRYPISSAMVPSSSNKRNTIFVKMKQNAHFETTTTCKTSKIVVEAKEKHVL